MNITYGDGWFRAQKRLTKTLNEEEARKCHELRKLYTVVVGDGAKPQCFLELNMKYVGVGFFDDKLRESLAFQFNELESGQLFLGAAVYREFIGDTDKIARTTAYYFRPDGHVVINKKDLVQETAGRAEDVVDVSGNWEPYPGFGKYESIIRRER